MLIRQKRHEKGLTQSEVAQAVGISERYYRNIELGRSFGTKQVVNALEDFFETPQRVLLAKSAEEIPEFYKQYK